MKYHIFAKLLGRILKNKISSQFLILFIILNNYLFKFCQNILYLLMNKYYFCMRFNQIL